MAWTDDRVEILKKLWAEGLSASQIARELGDVTRNAVIGKVHRLGLAGRASPTKPKSRLRHREHIDYGESSYPGSSRSRINDNVKPLVMPEPAVTSDGEPIYRKTFYSEDESVSDILVPHANGDAIREANGTSAKVMAEVKENKQVDLEDSIAEAESEDEVELEYGYEYE